MAKLITKFKYLKPGVRRRRGRYAKYIATREGVEKITVTGNNKPATVNQQQFIRKILRDFPDSRDMHEYNDYIKAPTVENATEFITRAIEDNAFDVAGFKSYAEYVAKRPRAQRFGSHGLFTDDGVEVDLDSVSDDLNQHGGNVWTAIISLRREDAERLGFDSGERWRDMLRTQTEALSSALKIPMENLQWYAAFHNESHHPHVHLIAYSVIENEGYLSKQGLQQLRSSLARDVFAQDLVSVYESQTEHRNDLRRFGKETAAEIVSKINDGSYDNPSLETLLLDLADRLSKTKGKKVYGYMKSDVKAIVDSIMDELASDEKISALYDRWYEQRERVIKTYTDEMPERVPLSQNNEFKSIKNAIIEEAMNIAITKGVVEDDELDNAHIPDPQDPEPEYWSYSTDSEYDRLLRKAETGDKLAQYGIAKMLLNRESERYDSERAIEWLTVSAENGYSVAKYMLGKLYLNGEHVTKNVDDAVRWLEDAVNDNNHYAEYLLGKVLLKGEVVDRGVSRAEDLLRRSILRNNQYAAYTLGKALLDGTILSQDKSEAVRLLTMSADRGFAPAEYMLGKLLYKGDGVKQDISRALHYLEHAAEQDNTYAAYLAGKIRLTDTEHKDVEKAFYLFNMAAADGNSYAEYMLGKMFVFGRDIAENYDLGIAYLKSSAAHGNMYAKQFLNNLKSNNSFYMASGPLRLLYHFSRIIQDRINEEHKGIIGGTDRKLLRKIAEKKEAHGQKYGGYE